MNINATLVNLYHVCKRECWLHANGVRMEHTSEVVYDGKLLHEISYPQRAEKHTEIELSARLSPKSKNGKEITLYGKIDFYDARNKIIHETKRSDKVENAHEWQVKYYLWLLKLNGIDHVSAILEYPLIRHTSHLDLRETDEQYLEEVVIKVAELKDGEECPPVIHTKICKSCSYYELCYVDEE
ncbi:CRISPR-associated protein Cas4 [Leadbetterella sp. DM7]|uniref:CRISPR-associated protein Cas4 n=1 Tax=Leadbetterella sp. DM7 TaxID=3235085 RepID=UPI00349EE405